MNTSDIIAALGALAAIIATVYGYNQYRKGENRAETKEEIRDALESKDIRVIKARLRKLSKDLESVKSQVLPDTVMKEIIQALKNIKEIQIQLAQFEMRCNFLHKEIDNGKTK